MKIFYKSKKRGEFLLKKIKLNQILLKNKNKNFKFKKIKCVVE